MSNDKKKSNPSRDLISNRRARYDYEIIDELEAGMVLFGTEVKSLREGKGVIQDAYVALDSDGGASLINSSIPPYSHGGKAFNHEEKRVRKLLLHKKEIARLEKEIGIKGMTIVPLVLYLNSRGIMKLKIGIAKGKQAHDKRETIKKRDVERDIAERMKKHR